MTELKPVLARMHLVERAAAAMGGLGGLDVPTADRPLAPPPLLPRTQEAAAAALPRADDALAERAPPALPLEVAPPEQRPPSPPSRTIPLEVLCKAGLAVAPLAGRSRLSEEISVIQHQVLRQLAEPKLKDRRGRVVLVTSARPGEGKSFTALNLASSLAMAGGRQVILVDADAKPGSLSGLLGCSDAPGIRMLASDPVLPAAGPLVHTEVGRLSFLPYGRTADIAAGAVALPVGAAIAAAVLRLADAYPGAVLVVDAPPCLSTSDPGTFASSAGQVVMVVEAERTQRNEVEAALDMVEACPTLQLVLNKARLTVNDTFGAYYGN